MRVIVIGLGSMGKRRIRLMREMYPDFEIMGIDSRQDRRDEVKQLFGINSYGSLDDVPGKIDCAFVCTSPLSHSSIIKSCLNKELNVFTEINLVNDGYLENIELAKKNNKVLFLSSTFFYREENKYIRNKISNSDQNWNYFYHVGQYLPDWHPWENINDFFVGDKRTNGCREILAIELPWLTKTFGPINNITAFGSKMSSLNVNYNDNFVIEVNHRNGNKGAIIVDVVCPVASRNFRAYCDGDFIAWNGTPDSVSEYDKKEKKIVSVSLNEEAEHESGYREFIVENAYKNEIAEFFDVVCNNAKQIYGFEEDYEIIKIIDNIGA